MASNRGGQGGLRVRDESCGRVDAVTGWVHVWGGNKIIISAWGPVALASSLESHSELAALRGAAVELADRIAVAAFVFGICDLVLR